MIKEAPFLILPTFKLMVAICDSGKGEILVQKFVQEATIRTMSIINTGTATRSHILTSAN